MKTLTLLLPPFAVESELAELLERKFGAACFPDLHRWTLEGEDATVFVDFDRDYAGHLSADELRHLRQHLDFTPDSAVHVHASTVPLGFDATGRGSRRRDSHPDRRSLDRTGSPEMCRDERAITRRGQTCSRTKSPVKNTD